MVANGWERQNMLTDAHFDPLTGKLTSAGEAKVQSVLNDVPQHHRYVFVHRAGTRQETAARIDTVEQYIVQSVPPSEYPPVLESAQSADRLFRRAERRRGAEVRHGDPGSEAHAQGRRHRRQRQELKEKEEG